MTVGVCCLEECTGRFSFPVRRPTQPWLDNKPCFCVHGIFAGSIATEKVTWGVVFHRMA